MLMTADTWKHVEYLFSGATAVALAGHAVNTFPTPKNAYGQWFLGVIKFAVGQRISAMNAFQGQDTLVAAVPRGSTGTGSGLAAMGAKESKQSSVDIVDDTIVVKESQEKTTVMPKPPDKP